MTARIPEPVIKRLPAYYRYLKDVENARQTFISSAELAEKMGLTASQVRQDMNCAGAEGRQGCGYPVSELCDHIGLLLGKAAPQRMIVVGMGNMGKALVHHGTFLDDGYCITAVFDCCPQVVGQTVGAYTVQPMENLEQMLSALPADIAVIAVPASSAQEAADRLYALGIRGFWNFAPIDLHLPQDAAVVNVHLDESLALLSYRLCHR